jgi:hypothetical protein
LRKRLGPNFMEHANKTLIYTIQILDLLRFHQLRNAPQKMWWYGWDISNAMAIPEKRMLDREKFDNLQIYNRRGF